MSVASQADPAISIDRNNASLESAAISPDRQDYPWVRRFAPLRWLRLQSHSVERDILLAKWALPLVLTGIVLVYEVAEHFLERREAFPSTDFVGEVFFFGILGPIAVWLVLRWIRQEWQQRERDKQTLQRMYSELTEAQEHLNSLHVQRGELLNRMMSIQEEERRRLAREIHDELGQLLTGLSLNLKLCQEAVPDDLSTAHGHLVKANTLVRRTIEQSRRLMADLRPTVLDDYGLVPAIREEMNQRLAPLGIDAQLHTQGDVELLPNQVATVAFRIAQEAITNVIRHADAHQVDIQLQQMDEGLTMTIEDDGVGLPKVFLEGTAHQGLGILGMQERARSMGGALEITSREPRGTRVRLSLPAQKEIT